MWGKSVGQDRQISLGSLARCDIPIGRAFAQPNRFEESLVRLGTVCLLLLAPSISGCIDVPGLRASAHQSRLAAIDGQCRSYGFVPGSSKYARCVNDNDQAQNAQNQAERDAALEAGREAGRAYAKESSQAAPPPVWPECKVLRDGQYSCVGK